VSFIPKPYRFKNQERPFGPLLAADTPNLEGKSDILEHRSTRQQFVILKDNPHLATQRSDSLPSQLINGSARNNHLSLSGPLSTVPKPEQGRLTRPARPGDKHEFALVYNG
jgi:hypothetical protein